MGATSGRSATGLRIALAMGTAACLLLGVPSYGASGCPSITDHRGDAARVEFSLEGRAVTAEPEPTLDILSADIASGSRAVDVSMSVAALSPPNALSGGGYRYLLRFDSRVGSFRIEGWDMLDGQGFAVVPDVSQATVNSAGPQEEASVTGQIDYGHNVVRIHAPLRAFASGGGVLHRGDLLSHLAVRTYNMTGTQGASDNSPVDYADTPAPWRIGSPGCRAT
jgi:hypothetical protein